MKPDVRRLTDAVGEQQVASSVFVIEIHGYHSLRYSSKRRLPSQSYASYLVRCAIGRGAYIVVMRGRRAWKSLVPELTSAGKVVQLRNPQNPVISPANAPEHFAELVSAIGA